MSPQRVTQFHRLGNDRVSLMRRNVDIVRDGAEEAGLVSSAFCWPPHLTS